MKKLGEEKWHPDLEEMKKLFPELNDESEWEREYTYDEFGNLAEIKTNGEVSDRYEYEYAYVD